MRRFPLIASTLLFFGARASAQSHWGLGPIGGEEARYAWRTSQFAVGHGENANYDGRMIYARIAYTPASAGGFFGGGRSRGAMWDHDYPNGDRNFPTILAAVTTMHTRTDGSVILRADDPDLFKFPFAYLCEVGSWNPTEKEVLALRKYLQKGGFIIVDDFRGQGSLENFRQQMRRIIPNVEPVRLDGKHPIFDSFYRIGNLGALTSYGGEPPAFYGVFERNDPAGRMLMIVNHNYDVSEYWEWSATGQYGVDQTSEAYKLGVNYIMYSLTR